MEQNEPTVDTLCIMLGTVTRKVRITENSMMKNNNNNLSKSLFLSLINYIWH